MKLITTEEAHKRIKDQIHVGSDEQYINLLKSQNAELGDLVRKLRAENQNLLAALDATKNAEDAAVAANVDYCDEITTLREKLRVAEEALFDIASAKNVGFWTKRADDALDKIREVK